MTAPQPPAYLITVIRTRVVSHGWESRGEQFAFQEKHEADFFALHTHVNAMDSGQDPDGWSVTRVQFEELGPAGEYIPEHHYSDELYDRAVTIRANLNRNN